MVAHARDSAPLECCGLLLGRASEVIDLVRTRNVADQPERRYRIDPADHFRVIRDARQAGLDVVGAYHSHPRSPAIPSATDGAEGFSSFLFVIVGLVGDSPGVTAWHWVDGNFVPLRLVLTS